jgi:cytosine/uracil/thiamine/allantoin permease
MGMYGSFFFVFIRAVVCIIWYGIQTFYAGNLLSVMLRCIFGSSWENFGNTLPASANITSKQLLTFFIAWILEFPFVCYHAISNNLQKSLTIRRCSYTRDIVITFTLSKASLCLWPPLLFLRGAWPMAAGSTA